MGQPELVTVAEGRDVLSGSSRSCDIVPWPGLQPRQLYKDPVVTKDHKLGDKNQWEYILS